MRRLLEARFEPNKKKQAQKLRKNRKKNRRTGIIDYSRKRTGIIDYSRKRTGIGGYKQQNVERLKEKDEKYIENF